jgi:hypothetical protein
MTLSQAEESNINTMMMAMSRGKFVVFIDRPKVLHKSDSVAHYRFGLR